MAGEAGSAAELLIPLSPSSPRIFTVDQVLQRWAGEFGPAQVLHFTLANLAWMPHAFLTLSMVFADRDPQWTCVSEIGSYLTKDDPFCNSSSSICTMDPSLWRWAGEKSQSTISEFRLICADYYKSALVQCFYFLGSLLGAGTYGRLSDSILGRRGALVLACSLGSLCCGFTALSPNYWTYFLLRGATGFNCGGIGLSCFVLATEIVGPSKRGMAGMSTFYFFSGGIVWLSVFAYFSPSWRFLYLGISLQCLVYCLLALPFLYESPRWYLIRGRIDDALGVLTHIAKRNRREIPESLSLNTEQNDGSQTSVHSCERATIADVFRSPTTRPRMLIMLWIWLTTGMLYYGINLNAANIGGSNVYLTLLLNAVAEVPGYAITTILMSKLGRRLMLETSMLLTGAFALIAAVFNAIRVEASIATSVIKTACNVMALFGVASSYNLIFIYTAELFPTAVRQAAMGLASQGAQVGGILSPLTTLLGTRYPSLAFGVFTAAAITGAMLSLMLPETQDQRMYETLQGIEADTKQ